MIPKSGFCKCQRQRTLYELEMTAVIRQFAIGLVYLQFFFATLIYNLIMETEEYIGICEYDIE
jgi:hypothetical protein